MSNAVELPRFLISAARKSSGKTTLTIGLCAAFARRGLSVQPFKKGPDYIDPMWLSAASGQPCRNLDFNTQSPDEITRMFGMHQSDISVIEGNKGLHDGMDLKGSDSTAGLASLLKTPVVLVLNVQGITRGVAPLILGSTSVQPQVNLAGVILNMVAGDRHAGKLQAAVEHYTDVPVLGCVRADPKMRIDERHIGLIPANEMAVANAKVDAIADLVTRQVDLDALLEVGRLAPALDIAPATPRTRPRADVRIGVAQDSAFGFYYKDDLEAFENAGCEVVPINTLNDQYLPEIDGLFIGGGFPETQAAVLEKNLNLRSEIRTAIQNGLPTYAECGGLMYLSRSITWQGVRYEMVGAIPGDSVMHARPQGRGYVKLSETGKGPWPLRDPVGRPTVFAAHEFHYSSLDNFEGEYPFAFRVIRGKGIDGKSDGTVVHNLVAGFAHLRDVEANRWVGRFVDFVRACREGAQPANARTGSGS
jgi:cobyrinic acid a,c-diamide synthase